MLSAQSDGPEVRLDEYDEDEWFNIMHPLKPQISREEFHAMWLEFMERKNAGGSVEKS